MNEMILKYAVGMQVILAIFNLAIWIVMCADSVNYSKDELRKQFLMIWCMLFFGIIIVLAGIIYLLLRGIIYCFAVTFTTKKW
jgi:NhaP-type Na+/H+ or K+/H+ antiporter